MKALIAFDALVVYPGLNEPFKIYTDASDYHMGAVMIQDKRPVACWSVRLEIRERFVVVKIWCGTQSLWRNVLFRE